MQRAAARAGARGDRPARVGVRAAGAAAGRARATTAATRCTPGRCWPGAASQVEAWLLSDQPTRPGWLRCGPPAAGSWSQRAPGARSGARPEVVVDGIVGIGGRAGLRPEAQEALAQARGRARSSRWTCRAGSTSTPARLDGAARRGRRDGHLRHPQGRPPGRPGGRGVRRGAPRRPRPRPARARGRGAPARRRRRAAAAPGADAQKYTRGVVGVRAGSRGVPRRRPAQRRRRGDAGWPGWCGTSATRSVADRVREAHPEVVGAGRVQAWVVGSGGGERRRGDELAAALADGVPVVVDADALAHVDGAARRCPPSSPRTPASWPRCSASSAPRSRPDRCEHARRAADDVRRRGAAQGPAHPRRRTPTAGSGSTTTGTRGWPPPAPATCSAG